MSWGNRGRFRGGFAGRCCYRDGFGDLQRAVVFERDVAVVVEDALSGPARGQDGGQAEASNQQKANWSADLHGTRCIQCRASWMN